MVYQLILAYITTAMVFFAIDFIWLSTMTSFFYRERIGSILLTSPHFSVAAGFYLIYVIGIVYFAVLPAFNSNNWQLALFNGALLGLVAYGTYDMTNLATLKNWSWSLSIVDMAWGTFLTAGSAAAGYLLTQ
ncbi:DUF2177 family protein, partial [Brucellaceae bacterium C25G]